MNMKLIVLDGNFDILGSIPLFRTLIWIRRYEKLGCFELYASKGYFRLLDSGRYLYRDDADELGVIEEVSYTQDAGGTGEIYAKGNFAESLLRDRVLDSMVSIKGNVEEAMRGLVEAMAISPADSDRTISHLRLGTVSGIQGTLDIQATGDNLSEKLYEIGNTYEISHRVRYDFQTNDLLFEVWQGKDRRDSQEGNSWAIFSNSFYNIRDVAYGRNSSSYKNFAFVAGEGEGAGRTVVTVDLREPGEERKELYVDARDLQQDNCRGADAAETYRAQLIQRGKEKLAEYRRVETISSNIDYRANLAYRKDFDLGDYCTYINTETDISTDKRITEITETYEGGVAGLSVTFGTDEISTVQQLIKREV